MGGGLYPCPDSREEKMKFRRAVREDIGEIQALYHILFQEMAALQPEYFKETPQDVGFLEQAIESEEADILLAEEERIIGFVYVHQQAAPFFGCFIPHVYTYVMDIAVLPSAQGQGVGRSLMEEAEGWAKARGSDHLELDVLCQNERAIAMYEGLGYEECKKTMRKRV